MTLIPKDPIWVESSTELSELCQRWSQQAAIAIDTEFMRSTTFYPQAALFQVGDGQGCYLLDPLAIDDFEPFARLMENDDVIKVFHSCSEDLEVFQTFLNVIPSPVFDTQIAAAFAGHGFSLGYAALINKLLGIEVPKSETRSDWLHRPLSTPQLHYAALDVAYLLVAYGLLVKALRQEGRLQWVESDCRDIILQAKAGVDVDHYYEKVKQAWKLNRQQLAVLQGIARWRELEARYRDVPRNRILKERAMWDMARYQPSELTGIKGLEGVTPRMVQEDGDMLLDLIAECSRLPSEAYPEPVPKPVPPEQGGLLKALKQRVRERAEILDVAPEVLVRKKDFEDLVRSGMQGNAHQLNERMSGWRREVVGDELLQLTHTFTKKH